MKRCFASISLLWLVAMVMMAQQSSDPYVIQFEEAQDKIEYQMTIQFKNAMVSGILVLKRDEEGNMRGTMMNEFGISGMNFIVSGDRRKVSLVSVMPKMNKWYIRKVIKGDLKYLFSSTRSHLGQDYKKRRIELSDGGEIILKNLKYHHSYQIRSLNEQQ